MPAFTIVTTSATHGADAVEVSTLSGDFTNDSEALGYSRCPPSGSESWRGRHEMKLGSDISYCASTNIPSAIDG